MSNPQRTGWSRLFGKDGQAMVEFALVAPLLLLFLYAIVQFGLLFYGFITVEQAAKIGVRAASLGESAAQVGQAIDQQISGIGLSASATTSDSYSPPSPYASTNYRLVWAGYATTAGSTPAVIVDVAYRYPILIPFFGTQAIEIQQQYTMAQEDPLDSSFSGATASSPAIYYGPTS